MDARETRYATVGDAQIAYQVAGAGEHDFVFCASTGGSVDLFWDVPFFADQFGHFLDVFRLILFDRRGSGASDPVPLNAMPTWEELAEDLTAVLDDVGSQRASVMGNVDSGPIVILFAAMHPERVTNLILNNTTARFLEAEDYPIGVPAEAVDLLIDLVGKTWGTEDFARMVFPPYADDAESMSALARMLRCSATPKRAAALYDYFMRSVDVREFLPLVQAPTLILQSTHSPFMPLEHGRYLAQHLPNATLIEMDTDGLITPEADQVWGDVIELMTGERPVEIDRVLTTVLFTDIVGSTERASSLGDQRWHSLLDSHDRAVRDQIKRFKGREVKTTGDGFLVSFDGPARAIRCAQAINESLDPLGIEVRMGLHTGECEVRGDDLGGLAVHIASRVAALATQREILVSSALKDLVIGSGIVFTERGEHALKGVPGSWKLFAVRA
jgi:class 3 adenylate cyclase